MAGVRPAGLALDAALAGALVLLMVSAPSGRGGGYFDIRGADPRGVYATYVGTTRRGFDAWLAVMAAMREGGYMNFSGKLIYATSKFFVLYDPAKNETVVMSDDFTYRFVNGIPVRTTVYPKAEDGYDLAALKPGGSTSGLSAEGLAEMCSAMREVGAVECFISADSGFLVGGDYSIPGSLVTDVAAEGEGPFLVKTAGREAVVSYIFSPIQRVAATEDAISALISERYGLADHRFAANVVLVLIHHDADVEAIGRIASEYGMRVVGVSESC